MSDEKALPCCLSCRWAKPILGKQVPNWLNDEPRIECGFHNFVVWEPRLHFCSHLINATGERHPIVEREKITDNQICVWVEVAFRVLAAPDVKHIHHKLAAITPLAKYARMTTVEKRADYYRLHHLEWEALEQQQSEEIKEEAMYQKTKRHRKRLDGV